MQLLAAFDAPVAISDPKDGDGNLLAIGPLEGTEMKVRKEITRAMKEKDSNLISSLEILTLKRLKESICVRCSCFGGQSFPFGGSPLYMAPGLAKELLPNASFHSFIVISWALFSFEPSLRSLTESSWGSV